MKILIIGNGFIATPIIQRLESEGHELQIFSRKSRQDIQSKQSVGDIFLFEDFVKTLSWKPQIIIHTAWVTTHGHYADDPANCRYAQFTSDLARYIANTDVEHLLALGTCAEYGTQSWASTAGVTKLNPENLYAQQKVAAFNSTKRALHESSVRLTWARIFQPYGPGQDRKRLLPYLINALKSGEQINLKNTSSMLDWITTRDIASAVSWVINHNTPTEVDFGTTFGYTNIELLMHLEELLGKTTQWERLSEPIVANTDVSVVGSNSPLFKSGWTPSDSLNAGLNWVLST